MQPIIEVQKLIDKLRAFRDAREWDQFHNPKDLAIALSIEANELLELYLWKSPTELEEVDMLRVKQELADVFSYALLLLDKYDLDLEEILREKIALNDEKYPVEKSKGKFTKYNSL